MSAPRSPWWAATLALFAVVACAAALWLRWLDQGADAAEALWQLGFVGYAVLGALTVRRRPDLIIGWLLLLPGLLVEAAALVDAYAIRAADEGWPLAVWARWLQNLLWLPALSIVAVQLPLHFPTGQVPGRRWRWLAVGSWAVVAVVTLASAVAPGPIGSDLPVDNPLGLDRGGRFLTWLAGAGGLILPMALAALVSLHSRRSASPREHLQIRWFAFSLVLAVAGGLAGLALAPQDHWSAAAGTIVAAIALALPAVGIAVAILRHRLYGIDAIIRRSAAYAVLTAGAALTALGLVAVLGGLFGRGSTRSAVLVAVVVAFAVHASWQRVQGGIDRLVYGQRGDPYRVLRDLGRHLELTGSIDDALAAAARTLSEALRLPSVEIEVRGLPRSAARGAAPSGARHTVPMVFRGVPVGDIQVEARRGESELGALELELIAGLAGSLGPLCHAAALSGELRRSLDRLERARDAERERIHRDLHDGVGPTLAGLALQADILQSRVGPAEAAALSDLQAELQRAFRDVATLIDGLRPKVLDEQGLAAGLAEHCATVGATTGLDIRLSVSGKFDDLPIAVESAAWFIAAEALRNVVRHAGALSCAVLLSCTDHLELHVRDDGTGITPPIDEGRTGLRSMRARAASVGGSCSVDSSPGGTTVRAWLPLVPT